MPQPTTGQRYTQAWHDAQEADERLWLDQWARLYLIPVTTRPEPATTPAGPARVLAGRP